MKMEKKTNVIKPLDASHKEAETVHEGQRDRDRDVNLMMFSFAESLRADFEKEMPEDFIRRRKRKIMRC